MCVLFILLAEFSANIADINLCIAKPLSGAPVSIQSPRMSFILGNKVGYLHIVCVHSPHNVGHYLIYVCLPSLHKCLPFNSKKGEIRCKA